MKKMLTILGIMAVVALVLILPKFVFAGPFDGAISNLDKVNVKTGLTADLPSTIGTIIKVILSLVGTIFLCLTIYGGILWMTAAGEDDKVEKSKKIITAAVIGLAITLSAYAVTFFVTSKLGGASGGSGSDVGIPAAPDPICENNSDDEGSKASCRDGGKVGACKIGGKFFGVLNCQKPNTVCCIAP